MAVKRSGGERPAQRRRTRKAIVAAAMALIARGDTPSVAEVAAAADVSRRTVFLHFPTFDQLLVDATVGLLSATPVERALAVPADADDLDHRVERFVRAMQHVTPKVERLGRALIRLTVDAPAAPTRAGQPRRGYRRIEWIESALAPSRGRLSPKQWRRLVAALAMVVGWEAMVVQRDVCALTPAEGEELSVWAAKALLRAALEPRD